jgi:putrescine transport system permease protein
LPFCGRLHRQRQHVLKISFAEADVAIPPYTEIYTYAEQKLQLLLNLGNYSMLAGDELYIAAYLGSLKMALISTILCLVIGYPDGLRHRHCP